MGLLDSRHGFCSLTPLQRINAKEKGGESAVILWRQKFCHHCAQKIHLLDGYREETIDDGAQQRVWHYHNACWYVFLQAKGAKWVEPLCADTDMPLAIRM